MTLRPKSLEILLENALQWEYEFKTCGERECKGSFSKFLLKNNKVYVSKFVYLYKSSYSLKVYWFAYAHYICFLMNAFKYMIFVQIQIFDIFLCPQLWTNFATEIHHCGQCNVLWHLTMNSSAKKILNNP